MLQQYKGNLDMLQGESETGNTIKRTNHAPSHIISYDRVHVM